MDLIRCLITDVPQRMLNDIVNKVVEKEHSIEIVNNVRDVADLPQQIEKQSIDVLITGIESNDIQKLYQRMIELHSDLLVLALVDEGRNAVIYLEDIGVDEMINLITSYSRK